MAPPPAVTAEHQPQAAAPARTTTQPPSAGPAGPAAQPTDHKPAQKRKRESLLPNRGQKSWIAAATAASKAENQWALNSAADKNDKAAGDAGDQAGKATGRKRKAPKAGKQHPPADTEAKGDGQDEGSGVIDQGDKKKPRAKKQPVKKEQDDDEAADAIEGLARSDKTIQNGKKGNTAEGDTGEKGKADKNVKTEKDQVVGLADEPTDDKEIDDQKNTKASEPKNPDDTATMSSSFDRQQVSFLSSMSAAASKLGSGAGTKRSLAPPSPSPSVGSTTSAAAGSLTPRRADRDTPAANIVYSQPALTGTGDSIISQMAYAVSWLRGKDEPQLCVDVLGYLSATARPESEQEFFVDQMRRNPQIQWIPDPALSEQTWRSGTYAHRPVIPGVKNKTQLLAYLQKKTDASGVSVKDLKDGWPDCESAINELEKEHRVLVIRAKKDGAARMVWLDDASLFHEIDPQLKLMWARVEVPSTDNIVARLVAAQQKPASEDPRIKAAQAPKENKKKKPQRRSGKSTNVHMEHLLKDYSHMKR